MTDEQDRIRLCEWQGWKRRPPELLEPYPNGEPRFGPERWDAPDGSAYGVTVGDLPDPKHNPADCEALIPFLNERGFHIQIDHGINGQARVIFSGPPKERNTAELQEFEWYGDEWKTGVVELALKVMDDAN